MKEVNLLFPHQLFENNPLPINELPVYLVEEYLFFSQYAFHKQKITFHRASMKKYAAFLEAKGVEVNYIDAQEEISDVRMLIPALAERGISHIHFIDPTDNWLSKHLKSAAEASGTAASIYINPLFLNTPEDLQDFFKPTKKKFFQTKFYIEQRKKRGILLTEDRGPKGEKWSFDADNRKKYPKKKVPPSIVFPKKDNYYKEAVEYVERHFSENPGELEQEPLYPTDYKASQQWLKNFLEQRFAEFGPYEDAIVSAESILNHSVLTPMLNVGLLRPQEIVDAVLEYSERHDIPLNTTEGFIRQVIGWREFIRGVYEVKGSEERTKNYWGFTRKIPASFYHGTTGIDPIDITIKKVLKTGYCHHIERLMVLGNFMVLCEFDPDEVYRWFMELFIDAYDWVMVPNVYGMSQFADGGLMSTKPYISGSNYLKKMSDYRKGDWQQIWDALFWRFMHVHRDFFVKNPRLGMLVRNLDKMDDEKRIGLIERADSFLEKLDAERELV
ncbi:MAG: cryptochrome/photolyase family protein [Bacteroidota bacterium]